MGSNSEWADWDEEVYDDEPEGRLVPCNVCHHTGLVEVQGQETDCMECDGEGFLEV